jgi:uncharacterized protein involved in exopolysaccharide biosynthesis
VSEPEAAAGEGDGDGGAFSPKEMALFGVRAVRQNILLCALIALLVSAIGITVVSALPTIYDATGKIFIQETGSVTTSIASGGSHYRAGEAMRGLQEFILARENLLSIAREAKLVDKWPGTRPWPMRIKDKVFAYLFGTASRKDLERAFAEMLNTSIQAQKDGDSVRINAQWRSRDSAYDIARLVQRNFLAARAANDLGPIRRAIPFLEAQLQEADTAIENAVSRVQAAKTQNDLPAPAPGGAKPDDGKPAGPSTSSLELANLSRQLADTRRQQRALMEPRRQRIAELKIELIDMSASYSPEHPLVRQREARIATLSELPPEVTALKEKEAQLLSALSSRGVTRSSAEAAAVMVQQPLNRDPELAPLQARLGSALRKSEDIAVRLEQAQIELATAEADFRHRYVVVEEPEVPSNPIKPKGRPLLFLLAVLAGLLLGAGAGPIRELRRGRLVDLWQVRALGIELLGEVNLK